MFYSTTDIYDVISEAISYKLSENHRFSVMYENQSDYHDLELSPELANELYDDLIDEETTFIDDYLIHRDYKVLADNSKLDSQFNEKPDYPHDYSLIKATRIEHEKRMGGATYENQI